MERKGTPVITERGWRTALVAAAGMVVVQLGTILVLGSSEIGLAVVVPVAIAFGPAALAGLALGAGLAELIAGPGAFVLTRLIEVVVIGAVARGLWRATTPDWSAGRRGALTIALVAGIAVVISVGVSIVAYPVIAGFGGFSLLPVLVVERLAPAIVVAPALYLVIGRMIESMPVGSGTTRGMGLTMGTLAIVGLGWVIGAALFDVLRRDVAAYPHIESLLLQPFPDPIAAFVSFAVGSVGWAIYVVIGLGGIAIVAGTLRYWRRSPQGTVSGQ